jgi:hypothetical protein
VETSWANVAEMSRGREGGRNREELGNYRDYWKGLESGGGSSRDESHTLKGAGAARITEKEEMAEPEDGKRGQRRQRQRQRQRQRRRRWRHRGNRGQRTQSALA